MNKYLLNIVVAVLSSVVTFVTTTAFSSKDAQITELTAQISSLSSRLSEMNDKVIQSLDKDNNQIKNNARLNAQVKLSDEGLNEDGKLQAIWIPDATENQPIETVMNNAVSSGPPTDSNNQKPQPKMIIVNPTHKQNETYGVLKAKLEDPYFLSTLNINDLASMPELQTLPEVMQLSIMSKAITKFNNGEIDKDVFMNLVE